VFSVLPMKKLLKFHLKEVMLNYLTLYLHRYTTRLFSCVDNRSLALVML
jgi:hypothetical protein